VIFDVQEERTLAALANWISDSDDWIMFSAEQFAAIGVSEHPSVSQYIGCPVSP
jgi:hypothetical protein